MRIHPLVTVLAVASLSPAFQAKAQSAAPQPVAGQKELARLQAQITTLQVRLEQLAPSQAPVAAAPSTATTAQDPGKRLDALTRLVNDSSFGATAFFDLTRRDRTTAGHGTDASGPGVDVKRFYLSFDHRFDERWSMNLTSDFNYVSSDGQTSVFIKKAYLQGRFAPLATLRVGSANMAWVPLVEDWYGYRFVESTLVDRQRMGSSADWGAHVHGDNGLLNYQLSVVNGGGYRNPSRSGGVDIEARVGVQLRSGLLFALGAYRGHLGKDTDTMPALHRAQRQDAMVAWRNDGLRLGAEWFRTDNWTTVTSAQADSAAGWSLWGSYDFGKAAAFARYDRATPSRRLDPGLTDTYWHAGVAVPITSSIRLAAAWKHARVRNGANIDTRDREFGVWGVAAY